MYVSVLLSPGGDWTSAIPQLGMVSSGRRGGRDSGSGRGRRVLGGTDLKGLGAMRPPSLEGVRGAGEEEIDTAGNVPNVINMFALSSELWLPNATGALSPLPRLGLPGLVVNDPSSAVQSRDIGGIIEVSGEN